MTEDERERMVEKMLANSASSPHRDAPKQPRRRRPRPCPVCGYQEREA